MKKYRVVKTAPKELAPWKREILRSGWRIQHLYKSEKKHQIQYAGDAIEDIPSGEDTYISVRNRINHSALYEAIEKLDENERFIIRSYFFANLNDHEIGELIGESQQVVSYRRLQALEKLRKFLKSEKYFL